MVSVPENQVASSHAAAEHAAAEINALIRAGKDAGASDIHLEPDLPAAYRVSSGLAASKKHMSREETQAIARALLSEIQWQAFLKKGSADLARTIEGVRCRINILETSRGVGLAIRLLSSIVPTIETTNLHPSLKDLCQIVNGLVLVSGPTGSGKSTTLAAFVEEINV
jgi:twitching motility protein PilT